MGRACRLAPGSADRCGGPVASGLSPPSSDCLLRSWAQLSFSALQMSLGWGPWGMALGGGLGPAPVRGSVTGACAEAEGGRAGWPATNQGLVSDPVDGRDCGRWEMPQRFRGNNKSGSLVGSCLPRVGDRHRGSSSAGPQICPLALAGEKTQGDSRSCPGSSGPTTLSPLLSGSGLNLPPTPETGPLRVPCSKSVEPRF